MDHTKGPSFEGQYFNFYVADANSALGYQFPNGGTYMIEQFRNGQISQEKQEIILWTSSNGGSIGDGHGRYNENTLTRAPAQWNTGDYFCFYLGIKLS